LQNSLHNETIPIVKEGQKVDIIKYTNAEKKRAQLRNSLSEIFGFIETKLDEQTGPGGVPFNAQSLKDHANWDIVKAWIFEMLEKEHE